jgi:hypothetical protein
MTKQIVIGVTVAFLSCAPVAGQAPSGAAAEANRPSNGVLEMSLRPIFPEVATGDPERPPVVGAWQGIIEVTIKNISALRVRCTRRNWYFQYDLQVLDSEGNPVPLTDFGRQWFSAPGARPAGHSVSVSVTDLEPSEQFTDRLNLASAFQLRPGGTYTVKLRRSRDLPPVDAMGRPLPELSATVIIGAGPAGTER